MTKKEAREILMQYTRDGMRQYDEMHKGEKIDFTKRLEYVNLFVSKLVPGEVLENID